MFIFIVVIFLVFIDYIDFQLFVIINNFSEAYNDKAISKIRAKKNH